MEPIMGFFDDGPLGPWPEGFAYKGEPGCVFTFIGFILFLAVVLILSHFFFN